MTNRRNFLKSASFLTLGGLMSCTGKTGTAAASGSAAVQPATANKRIGLQTYSLGRELYEDVPGGLKKVRAMGYTDLELAGYRDGTISGIAMADFKKMCDDAGLKIVSTHVNPPVREYTADNKQQILDFWKKAVADHAQIGCKFIIQPGQPSTRSVEETSYVGEIFNEAGKIAKAANLSFGYHNHDREFSRIIPGGKEMVFGRGGFGRDQKDVEIVYDCLLRNTDPTLVFYELDVYWTVMGQQDPVEYMEKYSNRIKVLHIKDKAVLGKSGMMNFEMIFNTAYKIGVTDYYVEIENVTGMTQFDGAKGCADYLLSAPFVK